MKKYIEIVAFCYICAAIGFAAYSIHIWSQPTQGNEATLILMPIAAVLYFLIGVVNIINKNNQ
jgi:p-aminobenzoyl-glutamate transporter AbgT